MSYPPDFVQRLIDHFGLKPLPKEGGFFVRTYQSAEKIARLALPPRYLEDKAFGTAILYLLTSDPDSFSAIHRLPTDEIYHFYLGDPVEMLLLKADGSSEHIILGQDVLNDQQVQFTVPRHTWQGCQLLPGGYFALLGTTMAPGFDDSDFLPGEREHLLKQYPGEAELIRKLCRY